MRKLVALFCLLLAAPVPASSQTSTIGQLPAAAPLVGTELFDVFQSGHDRQVSLSTLLGYMQPVIIAQAKTLIGNFAPVARSGSYSDLSGKPQAGLDYIAPSGSGANLQGITAAQVNADARTGKSLIDYVADSGTAFSIMAGTFTGDTTAYVQAALNACQGSQSAPGLLTIPAGVYNETGFVKNQAPAGGANSYCRVRAYGAVFNKTNADTSQNAPAVFTSYGDNLTWEGGLFDGKGLGNIVTPGIGILGANNRFYHVQVQNATGNGFYFLNSSHPVGDYLEAYNNTGGAGIDLSGVSYGRFTHLKASYSGAEGVAVDNATTYTIVDGAEVFQNGTTGCFGGVGSGASGNYNTLTNILSYNNNCFAVGLQGIHSKISHVTSYGNKYGGVYFEGFDTSNHPAANAQGDLGYDILSDSNIMDGGGTDPAGNPTYAVSIDGARAAYTIGSTSYPSPAVPGITITNVDHPNGIISDRSNLATILGGGSSVVYNGGAAGGPMAHFVARGPSASFAWQTLGQGTDANIWDAMISTSTLRFRAVNDANTVGNPWLDVFKTGAVPFLAQFYVPLATPLLTPSSSSATCAPGQFENDANYHYVCVSTNKWRRVALSDF